VGGQAPSGRCARSYSNTESSETPPQRQTGGRGRQLLARENGCVALHPQLDRNQAGLALHALNLLVRNSRMALRKMHTASGAAR